MSNNSQDANSDQKGFYDPKTDRFYSVKCPKLLEKLTLFYE